MKDLLLYLVKSLVDYPDEVEVEESQEQEIIIFSLQVNPSDIGKVIGRGGKIIKALRDIVRILAIKEGKKINILLKEKTDF